MKEGESVDVFAGKLSGLVSKAKSLGTTIEEETLVRKLLDSDAKVVSPNCSFNRAML
jgi:hypothetical protein